MRIFALVVGGTYSLVRIAGLIMGFFPSANRLFGLAPIGRLGIAATAHAVCKA